MRMGAFSGIPFSDIFFDQMISCLPLAWKHGDEGMFLYSVSYVFFEKNQWEQLFLLNFS